MSGEAAITRATASKILREFAGQSGSGGGEVYREELSARELSVLQLITQGKTNKEIGRILNIAENTVKNHLSHIRDKLQVENRVQAATFALEKGIVPKKDHAI
jgi:DNA-binding NarL/FixJ family response regulator